MDAIITVKFKVPDICSKQDANNFGFENCVNTIIEDGSVSSFVFSYGKDFEIVSIEGSDTEDSELCEEFRGHFKATARLI